MNNSTAGVTLNAAFINDVLSAYPKHQEYYADLFEIAEGLDLSKPDNKLPMEVYNDLCAWIEENLGEYNLRQLGRRIGETAYGGMVANNLITKDSTPLQVMEALKTVASLMIQDPEGRGWEIIETQERKIIMRRTQTFNSVLQFGLLEGLMQKAGVRNLSVSYQSEVAKGAEFDEYVITWLSQKQVTS